MTTIPTIERVYSIFKELNQTPRPSHHEELIADYLCQFAERLNLEYARDDENCVVIRKPATPGHENAEPIVLLNHMDMVCVGMDDPQHTPIEAYIENGWMKARGTSLGADNGIGLSMALAILEDDSIIHGPLEVLTTTNEEDGMTGAANLSKDFIHGRKVINTDSEDYDTITIASAGACLQYHRLPIKHLPSPGGKHRWFHITFKGGHGGHSGVDINKGRISAVIAMWGLLAAIYNEYDFDIASLTVGEANASIASSAEAIICIKSGEPAEFVKAQEESMNQWLHEEYSKTDPGMHCSIEKCEKQETVIDKQSFEKLMGCLEQIPQGVVKMSETMEGTVQTSNNVGVIRTESDHFLVSTHTRSFDNNDMINLSREIAETFKKEGGSSEEIMSTSGWQENEQSTFLQETANTFYDVLGWRPRMVAMHFVLEASYYVSLYPGIEIACIGPRIVEPHSCNERVELSTVEDIWKVLITLLQRLA